MKLSQTDENALSTLGEQASEMLAQHDYAGLAQRFGYALSFGRESAAAIEADYVKAAASPHNPAEPQRVVVRYFKPNSTGLFAIVECFVPVAINAAVLLELVVTGQENKMHITIEGISGVTA